MPGGSWGRSRPRLLEHPDGVDVVAARQAMDDARARAEEIDQAVIKLMHSELNRRGVP